MCMNDEPSVAVLGMEIPFVVCRSRREFRALSLSKEQLFTMFGYSENPGWAYVVSKAFVYTAESGNELAGMSCRQLDSHLLRGKYTSDKEISNQNRQ